MAKVSKVISDYKNKQAYRVGFLKGAVKSATAELAHYEKMGHEDAKNHRPFGFSFDRSPWAGEGRSAPVGGDSYRSTADFHRQLTSIDDTTNGDFDAQEGAGGEDEGTSIEEDHGIADMEHLDASDYDAADIDDAEMESGGDLEADPEED